MLVNLPKARQTAPIMRAAVLTTMLVGCDDSVGPDVRGCHPPDAAATVRELLDHRPFGLAISRTGVLYAGQFDTGALVRASLPATTFNDTVSVGDGPVRVVFAPTGSTAYVANQLAETVGVINVTTNTQVATMSVQGSPISLAVSRRGSRVYAGTGTGTIAVIDAARRSVLQHISLEGEINGLALHPTQSLLYASSRTSNRVWEISTNTNQVVRTFMPGGIPQELAVSHDGKEFYLADEDGPVQVWNLVSGTRVTTIPEATQGFGLALSPDDLQIYVSSSFLGRVYVIDRVTRTMVRTLETGGVPRRIAFALTECTAAIANEAGWIDFIR